MELQHGLLFIKRIHFSWQYPLARSIIEHHFACAKGVQFSSILGVGGTLKKKLSMRRYFTQFLNKPHCQKLSDDHDLSAG